MLFQRMAVRAAALVLFASCLTARAAVPTLTNAMYGIYNPEGKTSRDKFKEMKDVTAKLKEIISSNQPRSAYKKSMNEIFGGKDPIPGKVKTLHVVIGLMQQDEYDEYDMDGFWNFIAKERSKKGK